MRWPRQQRDERSSAAKSIIKAETTLGPTPVGGRPSGPGQLATANFRELRTCELRGILLLSTWVNKGKKKG
jgi:hypothetical protein